MRAVVAASAAALIVAAPTAASASTVLQDGQWGLSWLKTDKVWPITQGQGVTVAVIDSGVNADDPDLIGQVIPGGDFGDGQSVNGTKDTADDLHGTGMATIIAGTGNSGNGMMGLAPKAKILTLGMPQGQHMATAGGQAIVSAVDKGARVINLSYASRTEDPVARQAIQYAISRGAVVVAGVGNDGQDGNPLDYPGADPGVIGVTEIDSTGSIPAEAEYGQQVALAAPGRGVSGPSRAGGYVLTNGTSNATAYVSACAALVLSKYPNLTAPQVADLLIHTADQRGTQPKDLHYGYGIVDPYAALTTAYVPPANANPLGADLTATMPGIPSQSPNNDWDPSFTQPPPQATTPATATASPAPPAVAGGGSGSSPLVPVLVGVAGAVVVAGGAGAWFVRRRRQAAAAGPPPPWGTTPDAGQPPPPWGQPPPGRMGDGPR